MPVTNGTYANNETIIYNLLKSKGLNTAAICGILANIAAESGFNPSNLQNSYEGELGYDDVTYSIAVDKGAYSKFATDKAGYGLCQWTYWSRKDSLLKYAKKNKKSISNLEMQINFMLDELKRSYISLWNTISSVSNTADGAFKVGHDFCYDYERPYADSANTRGNTAKNNYWTLYSKLDTSTDSKTLGEKIVEYARKSPATLLDSAKLVHYAYNAAGVILPDLSASGYYEEYKDKAKKVTTAEIAPGDLIFYAEAKGVTSVSIANGEGGEILVNNTTKDVEEIDSPGYHKYILRILDTVDTVSSYTTSDDNSSDAIDYANQSVYDSYSQIVSDNLSKVADVDYDYGYLFDMTHGGEFKFYIPEFQESAGANYNPIELKGRSVQVQSYSSTNSRSVNISLDLYAGVGLYKATSDDKEAGIASVDKLHQDAYFLKSLEYPDYSNVITRPPATVHLVLGAAFEMTGVVTQVSIEHLKPVDEQNRAMYLKVSFTVTQTAINPPDYRDIRSGTHTLTGEVTMLDTTYIKEDDIDDTIDPDDVVPTSVATRLTHRGRPFGKYAPRRERFD